jgi:hypothetical protein
LLKIENHVLGLEMLSLDDCENHEICGWIAQHLLNILLLPGLTPVLKELQIRSGAKEIGLCFFQLN